MPPEFDMCGISGVVAHYSDATVLAASAAGARQSIRHRGPDASGEYCDAHLWFGHQRLSILDLSELALQPMVSGSGRYVICYNGEVYNYRELARDLSLCDLRSHSDTEVVLRAFEVLGVGSFRRLNGMFAFAVYDKDARKLWLVRDRLGIKPLYYRLDEQTLTFASEIKAIRVLTDHAPACDLSALHEFLYYGNTLGGRTLYRGIQQLRPGHYLELDLRTFACTVEAYWSLKYQARLEAQIRSPTAATIAETRRLLEEAVRRQLVSDVPVGVFLSGGVDSTAITAFASRHYPGRLATYAAGFGDPHGVDERPKARRVALHYGTEHHELFIAGGGVPDLVEKMVHHHDMPFSDAANIPLYLMAAQISKQTKVVLQGDGGDELFGGYRRYVTLRYYRLLHAVARYGKHLDLLIPTPSLRQRVHRYLHAYAAADLGSTMALLLTLENELWRPAGAFAPDFQRIIEESDPFARYRDVQRQFADHDIGNQMSLVDLTVELPDIFLEKVDRSTMAASLEVRVPFLDHDLVDHVVRIPGTEKMPRGRKKWLLKQALRGIVPDDVLDRPKTGFNVPFGHWLRTTLKPLFFDHFETFNRKRPGVLNPWVIREWYADDQAGRRDHSYMLWKILNFMIWGNNSNIAISCD